MPSQSPGKTGYLTGVLSLRGILALIVATCHTMGYTLSNNYAVSIFDQASVRDIVLKLLGCINVPVVFFVISGLAIGRSLERKQRASGGRGFVYAMFVMRRIFRLYPPQIISIVGIIALAWLFLMGPRVDFSPYHWLCADFFADWLNGAVFNPLKWQTVAGNMLIASWSMNLVIWSLYVEVCAIPVLPLFYWIARENNPWVDAAMIVGLSALTLLLPGKLWSEYWLAFYLGMVIQTQGPRCVRGLVTLTGTTRRAMIAAAGAFIVPGLAAVTWQPALLFQTFAAFAIVSLVVLCEEGSAIRSLDHGLLQWNGRLSYSFYLWHYVILTVALRQLYASFTPDIMTRYELVIFAATSVVTIAIALAVAQISYTWIEQPSIAWGVRLETFFRELTVARALPQEND